MDQSLINVLESHTSFVGDSLNEAFIINSLLDSLRSPPV